MLSVFTKSPVGRAKEKGTPNHVSVGIRTRAEPTPPKAKIKLRINEQTVINMIVVITIPLHNYAPSGFEQDSAYGFLLLI